MILHEQHQRSFLATWQTAKRVGIKLPETDDPDYSSLESLLVHVLGAARSYMMWMCEQLGLPHPGINPVPGESEIEASAESYLEHLLNAWRTPLSGLPEEAFHEPFESSRWGVQYWIDGMLEHAVMHPLRHEFQLNELLQERQG